MRIIGIDPECETTRNALFVLFCFLVDPDSNMLLMKGDKAWLEW